LTVPLSLANVVSGPASEAYDDAETVLRLALHEDPEAVAGTFREVSHRSGMSGVYDVAVCLAAAMVGDGARGGGWTLDFPGIDQAAYDARWVARFVSAYVNADRPTGEALFGAAVADGQVAACMATLAGSTLETLRRRID
jgi:hypothetical protein